MTVSLDLIKPLKDELESKGLLNYKFNHRWCRDKYCTLLVAVEGPEGSGVTLTTQILSLIFRIWSGNEVAVKTLKFPSEIALGCVARTMYRLYHCKEKNELLKISEALSFMADMFYELKKAWDDMRVLSYLTKSAVVVFDRYKYSLLACQLRYLPPSFERLLFRLLPPAHILVYTRRSIDSTSSVLKAKGDGLPDEQVLDFVKTQEEEFMYAVVKARELDDCGMEGSLDELCLWARFDEFKDLVYPWKSPEILTVETDFCVVPSDKCLARYGRLAEQLAKFLEGVGVLEKKGKST